jgi:hypothetical protein
METMRRRSMIAGVVPCVRPLVVSSGPRVYQIADAKRCRRFEVTHVRGARTASLRASIRPSLGLSLAYSSVPGGDFFVKEHGEQAGLGQVSSRGALWLC